MLYWEFSWKIHDIGVSEVKRIRAEMQQIIDSLNITGANTMDTFMQYLRTDPQFYFTSGTKFCMDCKFFVPEHKIFHTENFWYTKFFFCFNNTNFIFKCQWSNHTKFQHKSTIKLFILLMSTNSTVIHENSMKFLIANWVITTIHLRMTWEVHVLTLLNTEEEFLWFIRDICKRADAQLPKLFSTLPRCPYGVLPVPNNTAHSAPAAYYMSPNNDCSRAGEYYVNTYDLAQRPKYVYESTSLHETVTFISISSHPFCLSTSTTLQLWQL